MDLPLGSLEIHKKRGLQSYGRLFRTSLTCNDIKYIIFPMKTFHYLKKFEHQFSFDRLMQGNNENIQFCFKNLLNVNIGYASDISTQLTRIQILGGKNFFKF